MMAADALWIMFALSFAGLAGLVLSERSPIPPSCPCPSLSEIVLPSPEKCSAIDAGTPLALNPPRVRQLNDVSLERASDLLQYSNAYMAVLFHASWCPFSKTCQSLFDVLSSLFPNIYHVAVEESAVMPSVLSRYGVHSFPSLFLQNQTSRMRYHGSRDLESLMRFYKDITGIEPITSGLLTKDYGVSFRSFFSNEAGQSIDQFQYPWEMSLQNLLQQEPYLLFAVFFLILRVLVYLLPKALIWVKQWRLECMWHLNFALLSENTSPFLTHALHTINLNRIWSRLKLSKTGNFQEGAKNARVWASSLASVSLGKGPINRCGSSSESR